MVHMEVNDVKLNIPESWEDITLGVYEQIYSTKPESARDRVALVAKICGIGAQTLLDWPAEIFNRIVSSIMFIYGDNPIQPTPVVEIGGAKYVIAVEDKLSLGQYIDAEEAQKGTGPISGTLAIVCLPPGEPYDPEKSEARAALFAAQPMTKILGVMAFFLQCSAASKQLTQVFQSLAQALALLPRSTKLFLNPGGGTRWLQIWPIMKYWFLIKLLNYRLRKFSRSYNTRKIKTARKKRSAN